MNIKVSIASFSMAAFSMAAAFWLVVFVTDFSFGGGVAGTVELAVLPEEVLRLLRL